jgi:hypothetical protein
MRILKAPMKQRTLHNLISYLPLFNCKQLVLGTEVQNSLWLFPENRNNEVLACILYSTFYRKFTPTAVFYFSTGDFRYTCYLDFLLLPVENQTCTATLSSLCMHFVHLFTHSPRSPRFTRSPYLPQSSVSVTLRKSSSLVDYMQVIRVSE